MHGKTDVQCGTWFWKVGEGYGRTPLGQNRTTLQKFYSANSYFNLFLFIVYFMTIVALLL